MQSHPFYLTRKVVWHECALATAASRFVQTSITRNDLTDLTGEPDLTERDGIVR